jgi:orotidine-5'-phosphate decarboxylase
LQDSQTKLKPADRLIVALDVETVEEADRLVKAVLPMGVTHFKIGLQLFTRAGPAAVESVHKSGGQVFLDLKFHDIPSTVGKAAQAATRLGVWMTNLHIQGGSAMMRQALAAVRDEATRSHRKPPLLIGVTVLTSMAERDLSDLGLRKTLKDQVLYLARLAQSVGLDGIVASPHEARVVRWACGDRFIIVTPGIRPKGEGGPSPFPAPLRAETGGRGSEDQQRVATPKEAIQAGADYIVVGRPIVESTNRGEVVKTLVDELGGTC